MTVATKTVVDGARLGRRGMPRFPEVFGIDLPMKTVPITDGEPETNHPGLSCVDVYRLEIQARIDGKAKERQYDSGATLASYVNSTVELWATEAQAFVAWRDAVWIHALAELEKVQKGEREHPSIEEFMSEMPVFEW